MQSQTIPILNVVSIVFTFLVMFGVPFVVGALGARNMKKNGIALLAGFLSMFVMQIVIRIPILTALGQQVWFVQFSQNNRLLYMGMLAITASLFEESGRLLTARFIVKPKRYLPGNAIWHGVGHGGIESIYFALSYYVSNLVIVFLINSGQASTLAAQLPVGQMEQAASALIATPFWQFLIAGLERVLTLIVQIGFSVLAFEALRKRSVKLGTMLFVIHAVLDFVGPGVMQLGLNPAISILLSELVVLLFAIGSVLMMKKLIGNWKAEERAKEQASALETQAQTIPATTAE